MNLNRTPTGNRVMALGLALTALIALGVYLADTATQAAAYTLILLILGLFVGIVTLPPRPPVPITEEDRAAATAALDAEVAKRNKALARGLRRVRHMSTLITSAIVLSLALTPVGPTVIRSFGSGTVGRLTIGLALIFVATLLVGLPFKRAENRVRVRFRVPKVTESQGDDMSGIVVFVLLLGCIFAAIAVMNEWWWLGALGGICATSVVVNRLPALLMGVDQLDNSLLRSRLLRLSEASGVKVGDVCIKEMPKGVRGLWAAVAGFGSAKRILLADTVVKPGPGVKEPPVNDDEVTVAVAHEVAHAKFQDLVAGQLLKLIQLGMVLCSIHLLDGWDWFLRLSGVSSVTDPEAIILLLLMIAGGMKLLSPLALWASRRNESYADWFALVTTNDPAAFESWWKKAVELNLADPSPGRIRQILTHSHPTIAERIAMIRGYSRIAARDAASARS